MKMNRRSFLKAAASFVGLICVGRVGACGTPVTPAKDARKVHPPEPCFICGETTGRAHVHGTDQHGRRCVAYYIAPPPDQPICFLYVHQPKGFLPP
jgi:hypothetical protein